jgi:hypothetical protein
MLYLSRVEGKTFDILLHDLTLQFFLRQMFSPHSFIVMPALLVHARARQSDLNY